MLCRPSTIECMAEPAATATPRTEPLAVLSALWTSLRPLQWAKNLLIYAAFLFTINVHWDPGQPAAIFPPLVQSTAAFVLFCLAASAVYLFNDVLDRERDRMHPTKRERPLASGRLPVSLALLVAAVFAIGALVGGFALRAPLGATVLLYVVLEVAYAFWLKHIFLLDAFALATGFVLRAVAGAVAIAVPVSPWLYLCTLLGALLLGLGKRRNELRLLGEDAANHRPSLQSYTLALLDQMMTVVTAATVMAYSLYTFTAPNLPKNGAMIATTPWVLLGIFRYLYLVHVRDEGGAPEELLLRDRPLALTVVGWATTALIVLVWFRGS